MTKLGKVLKGLTICKGENDIQMYVVYRKCVNCPYAKIEYTINGDPTYIVCDHKQLMSDALELLKGYARSEEHYNAAEKARQDEIDSWSACSYG